jgi:FMN phosphatase YigB (HAD superfamily)
LITLYEGVEDSIKAMSQKHLLLGLLSNGSAKGTYLRLTNILFIKNNPFTGFIIGGLLYLRCWKAALERDVGHLFSYFQFTIAHAEKPETASFLAALKRLNILPQEAIYVGDAVSDIGSSREARRICISGVDLRNGN